MKFRYSLIAASLSMALIACGSNSNNSTTITPPAAEKPTVKLVLPEQGQAMIEGFPVALYVTYPDGEYTVDSITSIDINWPSVDIYQSGKELGFIDGASNELFYRATHQSASDVLNAVDLEPQAQQLWYVSADNSLYRYDADSGTTSSWSVNQNGEFTELAIDETGQSDVWLYDQAGHQLVHFNVDTEQVTEYNLEGEFSIAGLAISGENFLVLANNGVDHAIMHYQVADSALTHTASWQLEGFEGEFFNDVGLFPDGRVAVSTTAAEQNLYLVVDKAANQGDGPIDNDAELELVAQHPIDDAIAQPSGIWSMADGSWMLITDQAEMFALDSEFNITETYDIAFNSINCNQGCTEAIVGSAEGFYALADDGLVGYFTKSQEGYTLTQEFQINATDENDEPYDYAGLAHNPSTGEFYVVPDQDGEDEEDKLIVLDSNFSVKSTHPFSYVGEIDGSIHEFDAQGVHYHDGFIYVLSERYTKVLQLDLKGEIVNVFDFSEEDVKSPSDIAIRDGLIYIPGDHENHESVPPISVFGIDDE